MKRRTLTKPQIINTDTADKALDLPHERDQMPDKQPIQAQPIMRQAYDDLQRGLVDTDMHGERGVEELMKGKTVAVVKKRRHVTKLK